MLNVKKIRGLNPPGNPWATSACCGMIFTFYFSIYISQVAWKYILNFLKFRYLWDYGEFSHHVVKLSPRFVRTIRLKWVVERLAECLVRIVTIMYGCKNSLWIKPTDALNSNFIGITNLHVSGSLSVHHQEFLAVHRHWYILCSFDDPCYQFDDRLLPGAGWNSEFHPAPGSKR